ncbi:methyltransferase domain-containing protein [Streptomyces sp. NPDC090025]|uniref:methyltransferase domain-containing protein n=1 Tax=Streptomyces sp. NPDC090025 TaxID=3365922 RepID=UPI0038397533
MDTRTKEAGPTRLASALVRSGALETDWIPTYKAVPRDMFVPDRVWPGIADGTRQNALVDRANDPDAWLEAVYSDIPLTTQWDGGEHQGNGLGTTPTSSSSQPHMVFSMLSDLNVRDGHRVLEIGTGTGWNAALLAHRLGSKNVTSVEFDRAVADGARQNLKDTGLTPLLVVGDGRNGFAGNAPYNRIIATCSVGEIPPAWIEQTVPGGLIVAPWGPLYGGEGIACLTVQENGSARGMFTRSSAFMRLRQQRPDFPPHDFYLKGREWPADGARSKTKLSPAAVEGWQEQFAIGTRVPDVFWTVERYDDGSYTLWTYSLDGESWASTDYEPDADTSDVVQAGPRNLWDETENAYEWWVDNERPGFERFGLTVTGHGEHRVWLDTES